jgi:hypothetical protein
MQQDRHVRCLQSGAKRERERERERERRARAQRSFLAHLSGACVPRVGRTSPRVDANRVRGAVLECQVVPIEVNLFVMIVIVDMLLRA